MSVAPPAPPARPWLRWVLLASLAGAVAACAADARHASMKAPGAAAEAMAAPMAQPTMGQGQFPGFGMPMPPPAPPEPPQAQAKADMPVRGPADQVIEMQWAPVREFPIPNYDQPYEGPRVDFRETVFWSPSVRTGEQGEAKVQFYLSDSVTSFRASAEGLGGGQAGRGEAVVASRLPVALSARLPLEVSAGDTIELPVTISNATPRARKATVEGRFGKAFELPRGFEARRTVELRAGESQSILVPLKVVGDGRVEADGAIELSADSGSLRDALARTVRVVPPGFLREEAASGKLKGAAHHDLEVPDVVPGTLEASLEIYPSPTATLVAGTEAMLREPSGCFEQTSSSNYPNTMVLSYLEKQPKADQAVKTRATQLLSRGYKRLVGYESKGHGFEWFGADPGHEALTAYGVVQFTDMVKVFPDVDKSMIKRTVAWLKERRDGKGGYQRNAKALDSFGRAGDDTTAAYITHALTEAGERQDLEKEIDQSKKLASSSRDPYLLALTADTLALLDPKSADARAALQKLASLQGKEGNFPGARESITRSGGRALDIETTALAAMALMRSPDQARPAALALDWLARQRGGAGGFGSTQATVLALKALTRAAEGSSPAEGTISVSVNGGKPFELKLSEAGDRPRIAGLEAQLKKGKNTVEVRGPDGISYGVSLRYRSARPPSSAKAKVAVAIEAPRSARVGETVKLTATVTNQTSEGQPMTIARIGLPGGLTFQTWQLDELRDRKVIDFYETREREVIVYYRSLAPRAQQKIDLQLIAAVPGQFTGPASQAYLYYTDEHRSFAPPLAFTVSR